MRNSRLNGQTEPAFLRRNKYNTAPEINTTITSRFELSSAVTNAKSQNTGRLKVLNGELILPRLSHTMRLHDGTRHLDGVRIGANIA